MNKVTEMGEQGRKAVEQEWGTRIRKRKTDNDQSWAGRLGMGRHLPEASCMFAIHKSTFSSSRSVTLAGRAMHRWPAEYGEFKGLQSL